jgi:hypothetical protein
MNDIERLLAIESIKQTKARYFRFMDTKDWSNFATVFAPDAQMDMREESEGDDNLIAGNETIANFVRGWVDALVTVHHGHMPEIEFTSDSTADVIWAMEDKLWKKPDAPADNWPFTAMHGYGHYRETYRKVGERWLIQTTKLTRLRVDFQQ